METQGEPMDHKASQFEAAKAPRSAKRSNQGDIDETLPLCSEIDVLLGPKGGQGEPRGAQGKPREAKGSQAGQGGPKGGQGGPKGAKGEPRGARQ